MLVYLSVWLTIILSDVVKCLDTPGPRYSPTNGQVWPKPKQQKSFGRFFVYSGNNLAIFKELYDCPLLTYVEERFHSNMKKLHQYADPESTVKSHLNQGMLEKIIIEMTDPCEEYPFYGMSESYILEVDRIIALKTNSVWGVIRGLESLLQLFYLNKNVLVINQTKIFDSPTFQHRGLMVDTARHFISMSNLLTTLDAMAMNKMNVFHWHIVDDESFPFESSVYPRLSKKGAYYHRMVYNTTMIKEIVQFATIRGIRVVPEFSMPGHTHSWSKSHPEILTKCYDNSGKDIGYGSMQPTKKGTYSFLSDLLIEIQSLFPDNFIHLGGSGVDFRCWESNPGIQVFMSATTNDLNFGALNMIFLEMVRPLLRKNSNFIVWQDALNFEVKNESFWFDNMIMQVHNDKPCDRKLPNIKTIYSVPWDLGDMKKNKFEEMYLGAKNLMKNQKIVGGEALLWGHTVDDTNIISRVWPLTSAVAEVLWNTGVINEIEGKCENVKFDSVFKRLSEHTCRMVKLGIPVAPGSGPNFCEAEKPEFLKRKKLTFACQSKRKMLTPFYRRIVAEPSTFLIKVKSKPLNYNGTLPRNLVKIPFEV